jgi:hypothetical protein
MVSAPQEPPHSGHFGNSPRTGLPLASDEDNTGVAGCERLTKVRLVI